MKTLLNTIAVTALAVMGARADSISIVFDNPGQTGAPGATLHYFGVLTNTDMNSNDQPVYLNFDSLNFGLSDATVVDNFGGVPLSLGPGASSGPIDLFDITLANPETQPLGKYSGTYVLFGGMDGGAFTASDDLGQASFSATVAPEPRYLGMLGMGLMAIWWRRRERASRAGQAGGLPYVT